ncbi:DJ-1/PfpI family protein [Micromonospora sp. CPCC 205371]|nr:DJ-1/PfpI family protein [Micromonospora sp. CPCC 205371]
MVGRLVAVVGYDNAELLDIACVTTSLDMANGFGKPRTPYEVVVVSPGQHPITCRPGLVLQSSQALEKLTGPIDTLIVSGGLGFAEAAANPLIVAHVQRLAAISRRVASVCTGAGILAAAGLLDGKRVTTHWRFARSLASKHPAIEVDPHPIFIRDGKIATAAGITSALDLTLAFIEEDHGVELARMVARMLVTYLQRPGNQAQMSMFMAAPPPEHHVVRRVIDHINADLPGNLDTAALAEFAGVTPRHLTRLFLTHVGQPPGRFIREARTAAAAHLLVTTSLPLPDVASRCGLGSVETLRQAFLRRYGIPPSRYRAVHKA